MREPMMSRFIEGESRSQSVLFPERLEDWIAEDNPVRAVDAFVEELELAELGFAGAAPAGMSIAIMRVPWAAFSAVGRKQPSANGGFRPMAA